MSKEFIESVLKRYGRVESFDIIKIPYKKYENWKSKNQTEYFEYLFFIEKKDLSSVIYESPLNYIGSKAKLVPEIKKYLPNQYDNFWDIFGGGFNVGINVSANKIYYNDINPMLTQLINWLKNEDVLSILKQIHKQIKKFNLIKGEKKSYLDARKFYNSLPINNRPPELLFVLIMYGFNQQIRFNTNFEFNNPSGIRWFNDRILEKLISFCRHIKEIECKFYSSDYINIINKSTKNDLIYLDPPYMLTNGSYNDGKRGFKGWDKTLESELFEIIDSLNKNNKRFLLSYVETHKGIVNYDLLNWISKNNYKKIELEDIKGISGKLRKEILILNYDK